MYEDIVDYDDFSERVGSENDILDLWKIQCKLPPKTKAILPP